jgi:predicted RND superfamily exporter protein
VFFGVQMKFEEDITKLLPEDKMGGSESIVFSNLQVKDKIFILFSQKNGQKEPDKLIEICDNFIDSLTQHDTAALINDILYHIEPETIENAMQFFMEHLPVFVDTNTLKQFDNLFTQQHIDSAMEENFLLINSAAGSQFAEMICQDPTGVRNTLSATFRKMTEGLGGNYKICNLHFFTPDSTIALAFVTPTVSSMDSKSSIKLVALIEDEIQSFQAQDTTLTIQYHGQPVQGVFNARQIKKDLWTTVAISVVIIFILLGICFRNKSTLLHLFLPLLYGAFFSLTCMYFIKGSMSLMAVGLGAIVLGVALSYCLHILTHYKYVNSAVKVLRDETLPVFLGCLTTVGAFMGLLFTDSDLLIDFGLFASFAMIGTTIYCLIFMPQFFSGTNNRRSAKIFRQVEKINSYPLDRQPFVIIGIVVVSIFCFIASFWVKFDSNLKNIGYFEPNILASQDLLNSKTAGGNTTTYFASVGKTLDEALIYNQQMSTRLEKLSKEGKIAKYSQTANLFLPQKEQQQRIAAWKDYFSEQTIDSIEQRLDKAAKKYGFNPTFFAPFFRTLEQDYEPVSLYEADILPSNLMSNFIEKANDTTYMAFIPVQLSKSKWIEVCDSLTQNKHVLAIDGMYYASILVNVIKDDFNTALWISMGFVFLVLIISFKKIKLTIIAFIPMVLSWYIVLGIMVVFGLQFNLINIVISTFIFGIGVDYSIFVMNGLIADKRKNARMLLHHKTAIFFSALALIITVGSLLFASHPALESVGIPTLIGMSSTVLISYYLQPFLYRWWVKKESWKEIFNKNYS